ncbi:MAG: glycoside hydrolase family 31 protein [Clostridia bacterium]|nr:glycoside hydrolase family 31 protein [Clostridia bacterium]
MKKRLIANTSPQAPESAQIIHGNTRITVLTPSLVRVETTKNCSFCDKATQIVWYRDFTCPYEKQEDKKSITITTSAAVYHYSKRRKKIDYVIINNRKVAANNRYNLKGTARTLDMCIHKVPLKLGVIGRRGVAVMEDDSLALEANGMPAPRDGIKDVYVFASDRPIAALQSFFAITGKPPLVPRYALGNWWSRYYAYTQDEYLALMDKFASENIPFTVATIDMDWHWVDVKQEFGYDAKRENIWSPGWTGYSWNTKLFPDYKKFLKELHKKGLKTTVNLHPASGVRWFETQYADMCRAMGLDPAEKKTVKFDITDERFLEAYFEVLHEPYEDEGVDFWWIDWQQGKKTAVEGLDPLWALNHYHMLNSSRGNKKPLVLSRYSGLGSHRYPLGFSGDTFVYWKVLDFQVYFTVNATNAGYTYWSHDIGGHQHGKQKSDELYLRWIQFGVFSPILRLHSTASALSKEPWHHPAVKDAAVEFLRLRHRLIPYVYTMCKRTAEEGRALIEPLYYQHPFVAEAYEYKNEYYFGTELIVSPVVRPADKKTGLAKTEIWLPEGNYTNIFTGEKLKGGKHTVLSTLETIPVYAKEGAIVPLSNDPGNGYGNPQSLEILIYNGEGCFTLHEDSDDLSHENGNFVITKLEVAKKDGGCEVTVHASQGNLSLIPEERTITVNFADIDFSEVRVENGGTPINYNLDGKKVSFVCKPERGAVIIVK